MSQLSGLSDLIVLVADNNMKLAIEGIFHRCQSLGIRPVVPIVYSHVHRDPGCRLESHQFLLQYSQVYSHAIVMFDRSGCGSEQNSREELEATVEESLALTGWGRRAIALVLDPELEVWVWKDSPHVEAALGWQGRTPNLHSWLQESGQILDGEYEPRQPKETMEKALRIVRKPRSSHIYYTLATTVGFNNCANPTFVKLRNTLQNWFPIQ